LSINIISLSNLPYSKYYFVSNWNGGSRPEANKLPEKKTIKFLCVSGQSSSSIINLNSKNKTKNFWTQNLFRSYLSNYRIYLHNRFIKWYIYAILLNACCFFKINWSMISIRKTLCRFWSLDDYYDSLCVIKLNWVIFGKYSKHSIYLGIAFHWLWSLANGWVGIDEKYFDLFF